MMWDIAVALDPSLVPPLFLPMTAPDEMATLWRELGIVEVEQTSLLMRSLSEVNRGGGLRPCRLGGRP